MCEHQRTRNFLVRFADIEGFEKSKIVKWCETCGCLYDFHWDEGVLVQAWLKPIEMYEREARK